MFIQHIKQPESNQLGYKFVHDLLPRHCSIQMMLCAVRIKEYDNLFICFYRSNWKKRENFASIDESSIQKAAKLTKGAAGPSQFDADQFRRILCSKKFKNEGKTLREQIAILARNIATSIIDPSCLEAFVACRLIPLNKNAGVRPIGVGEILRRIIGKAIGWVLNSDIQEAAGPLQASAGLKGGAEAAIHVMRDIFNEESTDGVILVDVSNTFNSLNRQVALHNIQYICPPFATVPINTYRMSSRLFVTGGREISSQEGTTQGDNLAMVFYGQATKPLLEQLKNQSE